MADHETIVERIEAKEGSESLLYSDPSNPYESIYIRARVVHGVLTVIDSECEHGPDGGWSHKTITFDRENTEKVFAFLLDMSYDPFRALARMIDYNDRTGHFLEVCDELGIRYESRWSF